MRWNPVKGPIGASHQCVLWVVKRILYGSECVRCTERPLYLFKLHAKVVVYCWETALHAVLYRLVLAVDLCFGFWHVLCVSDVWSQLRGWLSCPCLGAW